MQGWKAVTLGVCLATICFAASGSFKTVSGQVTYQGVKNPKKINIASNSIIQWDDFSIAPQEKIEFNMASSKCAVLNRVVGSAKSMIHGKLESNGRVYLVNPNGVFIGTNAHIKAASFFATTGKINERDFLDGKDISVTDLSASDNVIDNRGVIETQSGDVYLVAGRILNSGKIIAPEGYVGLGAGQEVLIKPDGPERIFIKPGAPVKRSSGLLFAPPVPPSELAIENTGEIQALITEIKSHRHPYSYAISHSGKIQATKVEKQHGRIMLISEDGDVKASGEINAPGGYVKIDAPEHIKLTKQAKIDVSDQFSPGQVEIGSRASKQVSIDKEAVIHADNLCEGTGGKVVVLSKQTTKFFGTITAEAQGSFGDGGFIEVSSTGRGLAFRGQTSLKSTNGRDGQLLLDPMFAIIRSSGTDPATGNTFGSDPQGTVTISGADLSTALNSASVIIQANSDITFDDTVTATTSGNGLTLEAGRSITFETNSALTLNNAALNVKINDEEALHYDRLPGGAGLYMFGPVTISTQGGNVTFDVGTCGGTQGGSMNILKSTINAGGGNISISGYGCFENARGIATNIADASQILTSGTGTIDISGHAVSGEVTPYGNPHNVGYSNNYGIFMTGLVESTNIIQTENGNITITGVGAGDGVGYNNGGTFMSMTQIISTGSGTVTVSGTGGNGDSRNTGLFFNGPLSKIETTTGAIQVTGQGGGVGSGNVGIILDAGATIAPTGAANITVQAIGGSGTSDCGGLIFTSGSSGITAQGGTVTITADGGGSSNNNTGCYMDYSSFVTNIGSGAITINGSGTGTGSQNMGIAIYGALTSVTTVDGDIDLTGTGSGIPPANLGVFIQSPQTVQATGTGTVTITNNTP